MCLLYDDQLSIYRAMSLYFGGFWQAKTHKKRP